MASTLTYAARSFYRVLIRRINFLIFNEQKKRSACISFAFVCSQLANHDFTNAMIPKPKHISINLQIDAILLFEKLKSNKQIILSFNHDAMHLNYIVHYTHISACVHLDAF